MRIAIFSDVHGNLTALEAVLADINTQAPDAVVFAGDLCVFGPRPAECLQLVRSHDIACLHGNTDLWVAGPPILTVFTAEEERRRRQHIDDIADWTRAQLIEMERAWLRSLPFDRRISPTTNARDDLFIVHANPRDVDQTIYPSEAWQKDAFDEVRQTDSDLDALLEGLFVNTLAFGHFHVPNTRRWGDITLVNISSVSLALDGDTRAKYGLLTWDGNGWAVEHRFVPYDMKTELALLEARQPPDWEKLAHRLQSAGS
jgi:predicted phosphodiesterase